MFLRNYDNMWILRHFTSSVFSNSNAGPYNSVDAVNDQKSLGNASTWGEGNFNVKYTSGSVAGYKMTDSTKSYGAYIPLIAPLSKYNICIGNGNIDVTYDDYKLSGDILNNKSLGYVSTRWSYDENTHKVKKIAVFTYTNQTEETVTISEWGLYYNVACNSSDATYGQTSNFGINNYHILIYREVLEEPIVIEPGTTATLTFSVEIPMPNHP